VRAGTWRWAAAALTVTAMLGPVGQAAAAKTTVVEIQGFTFSPDPVPIREGESVRWKNLDDTSHRVIADNTSNGGGDPSANEAFDSGVLERDDTYTYTFKKAGTFHYRCIVHWWFMTGVVQVDAPPATTTTPPTTAKPTTTTRRPTTTTRPTSTTRPTATTRPPTTTRPTATTGPSAMAAPPPNSTTTVPGPATAAPITVPAPPPAAGPAPPSPPAGAGPLQSTIGSPAGGRNSTSSTASTTPTPTAARAATTTPPGPPVAADPQPAAPPSGQPDEAVAGVEAARGMTDELSADIPRSRGRSVMFMLSLAALLGVGGFGAWSLIQLRPSRTGR
jgi:plastocyanin